MNKDALESAALAVFSFFGFVFLALEIYFQGRGDSHMMTLMCGLCLLCGGVCAGWKLAGRKKGGDK